VYTALERKSIDGIITAISGGFGYRLFEVSRYLINLPIGVGFFMMLMNKDTLNSLPPDIQLVIEQVNREEECFYVRDYWKNTEEGWQTLRKKMEVYRLSAEEEARWRKAAEPIVEEWIKTMEAKGLPGRQAVEIMRQVARRHKQ
jgi:TRAP-type C4-dicarboxylate transport system substrate-binding protein